jgi:hypothetical protein
MKFNTEKIQVFRIKLTGERDQRLLCNKDFLLKDLINIIPIFWLMEKISCLKVKQGFNINAKSMYYNHNHITWSDEQRLTSFVNIMPYKTVRLYNMLMRDKLKIRVVRIF